MRCCLLVVMWVLACAGPLAAQSAQRWPVPQEAALGAATQLVADAYRKEYEAAKTPVQKQALASKMLDDALKTNDDPVARYAVLEAVRKIAAGIGDVDLVMRAVDAVGKTYEVDAAALRKQAVLELAPLAKSSADHYALTRHIGQVLEQLLKEDQYAIATELADLALASARKASDADLVKQWTRRQKDLETRAKAHTAAQEALATLVDSPSDPAANHVAGKFRCFIQEDWTGGLAMLALGEESELQQLAATELQGTDKQADKLALADAWYDQAQQLEGPARIAVLKHTATLYRPLLSGLSAIAKRRVENRLDEAVAAASAPWFVKDEWVEILDFVDLDARRMDGRWDREGAWRKEGLSLSSDGRGGTYFAIPVVVEGSYELEVTLTKQKGWELLNLSLSKPCNDSYFQLNSRGSMSGMARIDGREQPNQHASWRAPHHPWVNGRPYRLKVTVLPDGTKVAVAVEVNGKRYFRWAGPITQLTEPEVTQAPKKLAGRFVLGAWDTALTIHSVRLKSKTGAVRLLD